MAAPRAAAPPSMRLPNRAAAASAGVYTFADGRRYEGEYRNNMKNGHGVYTWADGIRFDGQVRRGAGRPT
jgi:hypothetical protein